MDATLQPLNVNWESWTRPRFWDDFFGVVKQGTTVRQQNKSRNGDDMDSYPLVMTNIAIENDHRNSGFSH